jgi:ABC-2 type transport system ATP-binding protein
VSAPRSGHIRVPIDMVERAKEALDGVDGLALVAGDDRPDILRISLPGRVDARPNGSTDTNAALRALLSAGVPVLSFEVDGARLSDAFLAITKEGAQ